MEHTPISSLRLFASHLTRADRLLLFGYSFFSSLLSLLDMLALGLVALVLTPLMAGQAVILPIFGNVKTDSLAPFLLIVVLLLILKNSAALSLSAGVLHRLSKIETTISNLIFSKNVKIPWSLRPDKSAVEITRTADYAVMRTMVTFIYPVIGLPAIVTSIVAIVLTLFLLQPVTALTTVLFFAGVGLILNKFVSKKASKIGQLEQASRNRASSLMVEMLTAGKELILSGKTDEAIAEVSRKHQLASSSFGRYTFLAQSARPLLEIALLLGTVVIGLVNFWAGGIEASMSAIALFAIAGFRLAPSIATFQSDLVAIRVSAPYLTSVLGELDSLNDGVREVGDVSDVALTFTNELRLNEVDFAFPGQGRSKVLKGISLEIPAGSRFAIVGPSGSGKSTLMDLMMGLLDANGGDIFVDNTDLDSVRSKWQRSIGYVPQSVTLFDSTIAQNVAMTWSQDFVESDVLECLERAQLGEVIRNLPKGIHTEIGENGLLLSGGQRQRLGIARALYRKPRVIFLDEATSALDNSTENEIANMIDKLPNSVTVIAIAHRLSTISSFEQICYLSEGHVAGIGRFDDLVASIPDFAEQARLGLVN